MTEGVELNQAEHEEADELEDVRPSVIYEAIQRDGEHELQRNFRALWWSGVAAGIAISTSVMAKGFFVATLPDASWVPAVSNLGYTVGFLIVILGRMQLFTENTVTPVLTVFLHPTRANFLRTGRLWAIVFFANMTGCMLVGALLAHGAIVPPAQLEGILAISRHYAQIPALQHLAAGVPAGFLIASLVWILPRLADAGEVLAIVIVTYVIGLGELSHVVAGATELFVVVFHGELGLVDAVLGNIVPAFVGNVIGGTGMFAALTFAQLRGEL